MGFIIVLKVDENFLGVESHSLMLFNWQKDTSPSHFLSDPTFGVFYRTKRLLNKPETTGGEYDFLEYFI